MHVVAKDYTCSTAINCLVTMAEVVYTWASCSNDEPNMGISEASCM